MAKLLVFNNITVDGFFADEHGEMGWAHGVGQDPEFMAFVNANASGDGMILLGRVTYDQMAGFWTTPQAMQQMPVVANKMNQAQKVVFSRTLKRAEWSNTRLVKGDLVAEVRKMKESSGPGMVVLGSGTIVSQLAQAGLVDEYQFVVNPAIIGRGRTLFDGLTETISLKLINSRAFGNGNVFVAYEPRR